MEVTTELVCRLYSAALWRSICLILYYRTLSKSKRRWQRYRDVEVWRSQKNVQDIIEFTTDNQHHAAQATTGLVNINLFRLENVQLVQLRIFETPCRSRGCCGYSSASGIETQQVSMWWMWKKEAMDTEWTILSKVWTSWIHMHREFTCRIGGNESSACLKVEPVPNFAMRSSKRLVYGQSGHGRQYGHHG
jgi:hypothetical protein